jgi:hypothetical protein
MPVGPPGFRSLLLLPVAVLTATESRIKDRTRDKPSASRCCGRFPTFRTTRQVHHSIPAASTGSLTYGYREYAQRSNEG